MSHYITSCTNCGRTVAQCRCPGPKIKNYTICDDCKAGKPSNPYQDYPDHPLHGIDTDILETARSVIREAALHGDLLWGDVQPLADAVVIELRLKGYIKE